MNTAASGVFGSEMLDLVVPPDVMNVHKTLLVWGASGSVGCSALQLAVAASYEVLAIAGSSSHKMLLSIGATECFDYRDSDVAANIVQKLQQGDREIIGAFDAISTEKTLHTLCEILHETGDRRFIAAVTPGSEQFSKLEVEVKTNFAASKEEIKTVSQRLWNDFLPTALIDGKFKCKPDAEIVGHGLEKIQEAINLLADGVSAKKLVVTL